MTYGEWRKMMINEVMTEKLESIVAHQESFMARLDKMGLDKCFQNMKKKKKNKVKSF
jgi:hypothetical protein